MLRQAQHDKGCCHPELVEGQEQKHLGRTEGQEQKHLGRTEGLLL